MEGGRSCVNVMSAASLSYSKGPSGAAKGECGCHHGACQLKGGTESQVSSDSSGWVKIQTLSPESPPQTGRSWGPVLGKTIKWADSNGSQGQSIS